MKKINPFSLILVPFSFLLVSLFFPLSAQSFQWSNHIGSTDDTYKRHDQILDAFVDGEDNSYFLVYFSSVNNVRFNGVTVSRDLNINYSNPFLGLFSFDCNGELRWYRTLRPVRVDSIMGTEYVYAVEIHHTASMARAGDKIVVALNALGNAHQLRIRDQDGNDTIFDRNLRGTNGVNLDPVVLFNFSGEVQWVKMPEVLFPTGIQNKSYRPMQNAMTLDADDNICRLIWNYSNFTESDGVSTPFPLVDSIDSYIVKYDLAGNLLQSVPVNLSGYGWGEPVFFCHNQQFHIFGSAGDYAVINGDTVIHDYGSGEYPNFFIRFDQSGNFIDYKKICRRAILCDVKFKDNHYYFMGTILANTDFLGYIPPGDSVSQGILVKLDTSANLVWAKTILSGAYTQIHSIHFLPGNIIAVGCKGNKGGGGACVLEFDDVPLPEWEWSRPTLAFLDESRLTFVGAVTIPTSGSTYVNNSTVNAILKDSRDNLIIGGYFTSQRIIIGEDTHANTGGEDIFIARYGWTCGEEAEWDYTGLRESPAGNAALRIYPNPTTGELRIENEELKIKNVEIFDIYGKNMGLSMDPSVHSSTITIDLSPLPAGIYLVKAMDEKGGVSVGKVVNQK